MIILDCEQGSPEWTHARIGIPTGSCYDKILTPKTLKSSASAIPYRNMLLSEWVLGYALDFGGQSGFMERGTTMEKEAVAFYEMRYDVDVTRVGFVLRDDGETGGSPDGLVGDDGGLEIKCPAIQTHVGYFLNPDALVADYRYQPQGYMYLTGRKWWDILSYNPQLPDVRVRIERDEAYIDALAAALDAFIKDLNAAKERLAPHRAQTVAEVMAAA